MAKIFDVDFRTGSLVEKVSGVIGTNTNGIATFNKKENGLAIYIPTVASDSNIVYPELNLGTIHTIIINVKKDSKTKGVSTHYGILGVVGSADYLSFRGWGSIYYTINTEAKFKTYSFDNNWHQLIIVRNGLNVETFIDQISLGSNTYVTNNDFSFSTLGAMAPTEAGCAGFISRITCYNHILTEQERSQAYKDFLNSYPIEDCKTPDYQAMKPTDLSMEKENVYTNIVDAGKGAFISDTESWTVYGNNTIERVTDADALNGYALKVTFVDNTLGAYTLFRDSYDLDRDLTIGKKYRVSIRAKLNSGNPSLLVYLTNTTTLTLTTSYQWFNITEAAASTTGCYIKGNNMSAGEVIYIDQWVIEEVSGLVAAYNFIPNGNTLVDISGNGKNGTLVGSVVSCKEGLQTKGDIGSTISVASGIGDLFKPSTVLHRFKFTGTTATGYLHQITSSGYCNVAASNIIRFRSSGGSSTVDTTLDVSLPLNRFVNLAFVSDGTRIYFYVDGVLQTNSCLLASLPAGNLTIIGFFTRGGTTYTSTPNISEDFKAYNRTLTAQEIKNWHNSFAKRITLQESFKDEGADGVSKVPSGWTRQSGSFKIGEHQTSLGNKLTNGNFSTGDTTGWSVSDCTAAYLSSFEGVNNVCKCTVTGASTIYIYQTDKMTVGKRYRLKCKYYIPTASNLGTPGLRVSTGVPLTPYVTEADYWQSSSFEFSCNNLSDDNYYFYMATGVVGDIFYIADCVLEEIPPLPTFTNGTKYLECVTAGIIAIPSKQAYGTWEFDWYKGADSNALLIYLINSNTKVPDSAIGAYRVYYTSAEKFEFSKHNLATPSTLISTVASYLNINNWYRIKITRSLAGVWTAYIKGGNNTWITISVVGGSGTNPVTDNTYTTSEYILVQSTGAGDRVTNFVLKEGIEV